MNSTIKTMAAVTAGVLVGVIGTLACTSDVTEYPLAIVVRVR